MKYAARAEDDSLPADARQASRSLSEAEAALTTDDPELAVRLARESLAIFRKSEASAVPEALRILMCALADFEDRKEALSLGGPVRIRKTSQGMTY